MVEIQRVGVNQYPPSTPTHYPLVDPSPEIAGLIADFYLSFEDDLCQFAYPFKLGWIGGFGSLPVEDLPGYPQHTNPYDVLVQDANDLTVFDSTGATILTHGWGQGLLTIEWRDTTNNSFCRVVYRDPLTGGLTSGGSTTLLRDLFVDTNGKLLPSHVPEVGGPWVVDISGGVLEIQSNKARCKVVGASPRVIGHVDINATDYRLVAQLDKTVGGDIGVVLRYKPSNKHHLLANLTDLGGGTWRAEIRRYDGAYTTLDSSTFAGPEDRVEVLCENDDIKMYVGVDVQNNPALRAQTTTSFNNTEDKVGFRMTTVGQTSNYFFAYTPPGDEGDEQYPDGDVLFGSVHVPGSAELDARTILQIPLRVKKLIVNEVEYEGDFKFTAGYNFRLTAEEEASSEGERVATNIVMRARPGDGLGREDGCDEIDRAIKTINQIGPDDAGNLFLDVLECYRVQRPGAITNESPREFTLGGTAFQNALTNLLNSIPDEFLADPAADTRANILADIPAAAAAALQLYNDCAPCCECDDFVNTYRGLAGVFQDYVLMGKRAETTRNQFRDNAIRWEEQRACRENRPLRLILQPGWECRIQVGGLFFNFTPCCLEPLALRLTLQVFDSGQSPVAFCSTFVYFQRDTWRWGSDTAYIQLPTTLTGACPIFDVTYDQVDPGGSAAIRTVFKFPACINGWTLRVTLSVHAPDQYRPNEPAILCLPDVSGSVPADITTIWTGNPPPYPTRAWTQEEIALSPDKGYTC